MKKLIFTSVLAVSFANFGVVHSATNNDCTMAKFMAGHALTVIKGGATLDQTLGMFEQTKPNKQIIREIYSQKDALKQKKDAEMIGAKICMKNTQA